MTAGIFATQQIQSSVYPDISVEMLTVRLVQPGLSAEDVAEQLTKPLEEELLKVKNIDEVTSQSGENAAFFMVSYPYGVDINEEKIKLEETIDKLDYSKEVEVEVEKASEFQGPIYQAAFLSNQLHSLQSLLENQLLPDIKELAGVDSVELEGTKKKQIQIKVKKEEAKKHQIRIADIESAIEARKIAFPIGTVRDKENNTIPVRYVGNLQTTLSELKKLAITPTLHEEKDSAPEESKAIQLQEIANIQLVDQQSEITRFNGKDALLLNVVKKEDGDTVKITEQIRAIIDKYKKKNSFTFYEFQDQGKEIQKSISTLVKEGLYGALFTAIVIAIFLRNFRATFIAILSLPISIFATITFLNQINYTLNMMTLGGLAVAVGRIVDDSIVVMENIFRWKREQPNANHQEVIVRATKEVATAVISSTAVTLVVFLPLAFLDDIIGEFFRPFAAAVVVSILVSLFVSLALIPAICKNFFARMRQKKEKKKSKWIQGYEKLLKGALKWKKTVLTLGITLSILSFSLVPFLGVAFLPTGGSTWMEMEVQLPVTSDLTKTKEFNKKVEDYLDKQTKIDLHQASIGTNTSNDEDAQQTGKTNIVSYRIKLTEGSTADELLNKLETEVTQLVNKEMEGAKVKVEEIENGPPSGEEIEFLLYSNNISSLQTAAKKIENELSKYKEIKNLNNDAKELRPKWEITLNQRGQELNLNPEQLIHITSEQLSPQEVEIDERKKDSLLIVYDQQIANLEQLRNLEIPIGEKPLLLKEIANVRQYEAPVDIQHRNGKLYTTVSAKIKSDSLSTEDLEQKITSLSLPSDVVLEVGGDDDDIEEGFLNLGLAMIVATGMVFIILQLTFRSYTTPLLILSSLIFVPMGSIIGLLITNQALSMSAMIGLLMLIGIVSTNAIVLVDRIERNRRSGIGKTEAIIEAAKTRLRPICMTAFATIFALIPLALSGASSELISKGLAITVIGGLTTSTFLTLILVPVLYHIAKK